jgi:hypothetical protein
LSQFWNFNIAHLVKKINTEHILKSEHGVQKAHKLKIYYNLQVVILPNMNVKTSIQNCRYMCSRAHTRYISDLHIQIPHIPYNKEVLIGLAKKCSAQTHLRWHDLLPIRFSSMEGPPPNLLWYIFLTVRCLSRTINSRRVLQLCQKLESEFTRKRSAQKQGKQIDNNTKNDIISKSMFTISVMKQLIQYSLLHKHRHKLKNRAM